MTLSSLETEMPPRKGGAMTESTGEYPQLTRLLRSKGHSEMEIAKILNRVRQYDKEMEVDSVMDSIAAGRMDLMGIINEALKEE